MSQTVRSLIRRRGSVLDAPFSIEESAPARASRRRDQIAGRPVGRGTLAVFGSLGWLLTGVAVNESLAVRVVVGGLVAVLTVLVGLWMIYVCCLVAAPKAQRDAARARLRDLKTAKDKYAITPVEATHVPAPTDDRILHLRARIRNDGRGSWFSAIIEALEGPDQALVDPDSTLYWMDRPGIDEEIPPGEGRNIGVAVLGLTHEGLWSFEPMSSTGPRNGGRHYYLKDGRNIAWIRVSARRDPGIDYYRRFGVVMDLKKGQGPPAVSLIESSTGESEHLEDRPSFERLLDF